MKCFKNQFFVLPESWCIEVQPNFILGGMLTWLSCLCEPPSASVSPFLSLSLLHNDSALFRWPIFSHPFLSLLTLCEFVSPLADEMLRRFSYCCKRKDGRERGWGESQSPGMVSFFTLMEQCGVLVGLWARFLSLLLALTLSVSVRERKWQCSVGYKRKNLELIPCSTCKPCLVYTTTLRRKTA